MNNANLKYPVAAFLYASNFFSTLQGKNNTTISPVFIHTSNVVSIQMKKVIMPLLLFLFLFGVHFNAISQYETKPFYKTKSLLKKAIIPSLLAGSALLITNSNFEIRLQRNVKFGIPENFNTTLDDYTRFAPLAQMYAADVFGVESRSHWFDQTKNAVIAMLITDLITSKLKSNIVKTRPNGANDNAFPSAHTSYAFTSATILYEEFKDTKPVLAYSGFAFAITTGYLRMAKDAHWFSDVLLGAGIGIAVTKLVYHFDYLFAWNPFKYNENIMIAPSFDGQSFGIGGIIQF
jgi:membrane-associated phospholipid phosphatase